MLNTLSSKMQKYVSRRSEIFSPAPERPSLGAHFPRRHEKTALPVDGYKGGFGIFCA